VHAAGLPAVVEHGEQSADEGDVGEGEGSSGGGSEVAPATVAAAVVESGKPTEGGVETPTPAMQAKELEAQQEREAAPKEVSVRLLFFSPFPSLLTSFFSRRSSLRPSLLSLPMLEG
jgi:hypothetical protein